MPITAKSHSGIVRQVMGEYKKRKLHSGKGGPVVKHKRQAIAIALSEARQRGYR